MTNLGEVFLRHLQLALRGVHGMANLPPPSLLPFGQVSEPITSHQQLKNILHETLIKKGVTFTFYVHVMGTNICIKKEIFLHNGWWQGNTWFHPHFKFSYNLSMQIFLPLIFVSNTDTFMSMSKFRVSLNSFETLRNSDAFPRIWEKEI